MLAHKMLDDMIGYLATLRERPVWHSMPEAIRKSFAETVPIHRSRREDFDALVEGIRQIGPRVAEEMRLSPRP